MSRFKKAIKYTETSVSLDEKIAKANKEFEKTGVLLEGPANRTSGIYYADKENPGTDAVMTPVPDPNGVTNSGYVQPSNGYNASDSSTWANAYPNTDWLYNSNDVGGETDRPVLLSPNTPPTGQTIGRFGPGGGLVRASIGHGMGLGYLKPDNTYQMVLNNSYWGTLHIPNDSNRYGGDAPYRGYTDAEWALLQDAYTKMLGTTFGREIKFWDSYSYFWYGSWEGTSLTKKEVAGGARYVLQTGYISGDPHNYESTPATPPTTTVIFKDPLDKVENLPTDRGKLWELLKKLFDLGKGPLDWLGGTFGDLGDQIGWGKGIADSIDKNEPYIADEPTDKELEDFFDNFGYGGLYDSRTPINDKKQNYSDDNFYVDDKGKVHAHNEQSLKDYPPTANTYIPGPPGTNSIGSRGEAQTQISQNENGDWVFSYEDHAYHNLNSTDSDEVQGPATTASDIIHNRADKKYNRKKGDPNTGGMTGYPPNIRGDNVLTFEVNVNDIPNVELRNKILKQIEERERRRRQTYTLSHIPQGEVLTEKNHLRDLREKKREKTKKVADKIFKINIPGPKDHLTVKAIDMLRQYKVSEKEMQEYAMIIGRINQWIRDNPKEYEIWKVRYPANDPRLAELNWRMDQQLKASEEYVDSRFPENVRLFDKLKQKIETNIQVTDPANFKDVKPVVTHKKLLQVSKILEKE